MEFKFTDDQALLLEALDGVIGEVGEPERCNERFLSDAALEQRLIDADFFSLAQNGYSTLDAMLVALTLCRLPACVEAAASLLVGPLLPPDAARPIALVHGKVSTLQGRAVRFLPAARTLVVLDEAQVYLIELQEGDAQSCDTHYAYPYGVLAPQAIARARRIDVDPGRVLDAYRLVVAAEITAAAEAALERTLRQVKERQQFGRFIGSFQAVQHRLAVDAASIEASRLLALRAAHSERSVDIAAAAGYAQDMARQLTFDFHQFSGAMGLTLEYPLHLWTYRIRALQGELGGSQAQLAAVGDLV